MPRVRYRGKRQDERGLVMHDYEDDKGGVFSVPDAVPQAQLPAEYEQQLQRGFETFKQQPAEVQEFERGRYNELAAATQAANPPEVFSPPERAAVPALPEDYRGRTHIRLPEAQSFDSLTEKPPYAWPSAEGILQSARPPAQARVAVRPHDQEAVDHEALHVAAASPRGEQYDSMSPREREQWRVYTALRNEDDDHLAHEMQRQERLKSAVSTLRQKLGL
jgi:hypothetical protein